MLPNCVFRILEICAPTLVTNDNETNLSGEAIKLNDSVYQLHKPEGDPNVQVLFFHGLLSRDSDEMHLSTWQNDDGCIWPKTWLREEFPNAQILVVSYIEGLRKGCAQSFNMHNISENLIQDLMLAGIGQKPYCPVVLVGHSFGGLVIKKLCLQAYKTPIRGRGGSDVENFLENLRGIFYYSTPHLGSPHIDKAEEVLKGPLFKYFKTLSTGAAKLNQKFDNLRSSKDWQIEGLGEGCQVESGRFKGCIVVPEASARGGDKFNLESTADHFSICQPKDKTSRRFNYLTTLLHSISDKMKEEKKIGDEIRKKEEAVVLKRTIRQDLQEDVLNRKLIGIDIRVKEVKAKLEKLKILSFIGMGGVGKSTLAKVVFNEVSPDFEYTCFINDVKSKGDQCDLEDEVWKRMHHNGRRVAETEEWSDLKGKGLLLVLDDILGDRDISFLSCKANICSPQSRFIVTTRDCDKVSKSLEDVDIDIYEVPFLDKENSSELFMIKAFAKENPIPEVISLMEEIVRKCDGLPLTLAVIGSYLRRGRKEDMDAYVKRWTQTLNALDQAEQVTPIDEKLWAKLRLSYDSLAEKEKEIFLDATTFFSDTFNRTWGVGCWTLREAKAAWREAYSTNYERCNELLLWQTLVDRGLVYDVGEDGQIEIHEQLLSLGRKIASESHCKIRVWDRTVSQISTLLQNNENKEFHALKLADDNTIPDHALPRLKKLRYLEANFSDRVGKPLPSELVLLKCSGLQTLQSILPADLRGNLAVLRLSEVEFVPSFIGQFSSLRIFTSEWSSKSKGGEPTERPQIIPDEIGELIHLEYLEFSYNVYVQSLPETFGNLSNLCDLRILYCDNLRFLSNSFGHLVSLQNLEIHHCHALNALPEDFGNLSRLKHLELSDCILLHALPDSFGNLSALEHLQLSGCQFEALPDSFGDLSSLARLELENCESLYGLPKDFGNLSRLKHLAISGCDLLHALPDSFGNLSALEHLQLSGCQFEALPDSFGDLSSLAHLELENCESLYGLPKDFGNLSRLKHLAISGCDLLHALPDSFGNLSALEHLQLSDCQFEAPPKSFGQLSKLTQLVLIDCGNWVSLIPFGQFIELQYLNISGIDDIVDLDQLPDAIGELKALHRLIILKLSMKSIPNWIKSIQSLKILELGHLPFVQDLPSWLAEKYGLPLALSDKVFHVNDGHWTLVSENTETSLEEEINKIRKKAMKMVEKSDYERALRYLSPYNLGELESGYQRFLLQERGIVKRFNGDLHGALEDLTRAAGALSEADVGQGPLYEIWKHRGYVNFLLENLDDAEKDGAMAVNLAPMYECHNVLRKPFFTGRTRSSTLSAKPVTYMGFRLGERMGFKLDKLSELVDSAHSQVMEKVRESDFKGALSCWDVIDTGACSSPHKLFVLQERGVLMRSAGDLHGALKCLTAALEIYGNPINVDAYKSEVDSYGYNCWKHRGLVNFLLGDLDRAQKDGVMALKVRHCQLKEEQKLKWKIPEFFSDQLEMPSNLGEEPVNYMHFRLGGLTDPGHRERLYSSGEKLKEKLSVSDFSGALTIWDAVEVDGKVSSLSEWFIFLLQRGTLKRLAGDLHGALGDLTMALETIGDSEDLTTAFKSLKLSDSFLYECLKQRGFVDYLLGDWDGARENGTMALKDPKFNAVYSEGEDGDKYTYNCWKHAGYVKYLLEALDGAKDDGAIALSNGSNQATKAAAVLSRSVDEESETYLATVAACESIGARELDIIWGDNENYWKWCTKEGARFSEVAYLEYVWWLEVKGRWLGHLSPGAYTLSWRLFLTDDVSWRPGPVQFSFKASDNARCTTECYLTVQEAMASIESSDGQQLALCYTWDPYGWMELAVGEFTIENDDLPVEIEFSMKEISSWHKAKLFLDGVVICPSSTVQNRREQEYYQRAARSSHDQVMNMVRVSDYRGALAIWEGVDSRRFPPSVPVGLDQVFFLQEKGILKRDLDDLHGALEDLTAALEIDKDNYESLKHRAYVKYLLKDLDGARMDAERCLAMSVKQPDNSDNSCLGVRSVAFLEFEL